MATGWWAEVSYRIAPPPATATAKALTPSAIGTLMFVDAVPATATADALAPTIGSTGSFGVNAVPATATAAALVPTIGGGSTIVAPPATATAAAPTPAVSTTRTPVSEFLFPEGAGNALSTYGGYTLTPDAPTSWAGSGANGRVQGPFTGALGPAGAASDWSFAFTLTCNTAAAPAGQFIGLITNANANFYIQWYGTQSIAVWTGGAPATLVSPANSIVAGNTYDIVVTNTGGTAGTAVRSCYINGVLAVTDTPGATTVAVDLSTVYNIGKGSGNLPIGPATQYAYIDNVRTWNVCLTAGEAAALTAPATPPPTLPGTRQLLADYSTNSVLQWNRVENHNYAGAASGYTETYPLDVVSDPAGGFMARYEIRPGDTVETGIERSEAAADTTGVDTGGVEGSVWWYQFSTKFDTTYQPAPVPWATTNHWTTVGGAQLPVRFELGADEWRLVVVKYSDPATILSGTTLWSTPVDRGNWHDIQMQVNWSVSDSVGSIQLWHNGVRQTFLDGSQTYATRTLVPTTTRCYYKEGLFRTGSAITDVVYHKGFEARLVSTPVVIIPPPPVGDYPPVGAPAFYVSANGNDSNPGSSLAPWKTPARAMQRQYLAGEYLLFERGAEFFGEVHQNVARVPSGAMLTVGAYGDPALPKPKIGSYKILNNAGAWVQTSTNVWRIDLISTSTHGGSQVYSSYSGPNIGHLLVDGVLYGNRKKTLAELNSGNTWDFHCPNNVNPPSPYLYVRAPGNPTNLVGELRAAGDPIEGGGGGLFKLSNVTVRDIDFFGSGSNPISLYQQVSANGVVRDCILRNQGGSYLIGYGDNTVRYSEGFNYLGGANNWDIYNNEIYDVYDCGFTCQLSGTFTNIHVHDNHFYRCGQGVEMWSTGGSMSNIIFENNLMEDMGFGNLADSRDYSGGIQPLLKCAWLSFNWGQAPVNLESRFNTIKRCKVTYRFHDSNNPYPTSWNFHHNDIQLVSGTYMDRGFSTSWTINNAAAWAASRSTEVGSTFTIL